MTDLLSLISACAILGVYELFRKEFSEPLDSRYIHDFVTTDTGKLLIFTAIPYLLFTYPQGVVF